MASEFDVIKASMGQNPWSDRPRAPEPKDRIDKPTAPLTGTPQSPLDEDRRRAPERAGREGDSQPLPIPNDQPNTQTVAIGMIVRRKQLGIQRYGTALQPGNGRDSLWDAVEESLDMFIYLLNYWREQHPDAEYLPS